MLIISVRETDLVLRVNYQCKASRVIKANLELGERKKKSKFGFDSGVAISH